MTQAPEGDASPPGNSPPATTGPRRSRAPWVVTITLAVTLLLCAGGATLAFLLLRGAESGEGAAEPAAAVQEFLTAVYQERDVDRAAAAVCASARDRDRIAAKVAEVEQYAATHDNPRFRWSTPQVDDQTNDRATVSTTVTITTTDEKVADQTLRFTVVEETGWWVCEVD